MTIATVEIAAAPSLWDLPFFQARQWKPTLRGNYTADCAIGRRAAGDVIEIGRATGNPMIVKAFLQAVAEAGVVGAAEIGALGMIAEAAVA